jgi:hypothetical protein
MKAYIAGTGPAPTALVPGWQPQDPFTGGSSDTHFMSGHCLNGRYSYQCWYNKYNGNNQIHRRNWNDDGSQWSGNMSLSTGYSHVEAEGMSMYFSGSKQYAYFGINDGAPNGGSHLFNLCYYTGDN